MALSVRKNTARAIIKDLKKIADKKRAVFVAGYFKTAKGQYGEGDIFIGVTVPSARGVAKIYKEAPLSEVLILLKSKIHEHRLVALFILCNQYQKRIEDQEKIFEQYLRHTKWINNWDLVDTSARDIIGHYIWNYYNASKRRVFLNILAHSNILWERRIAVIATFYGIQRGKFAETFDVAETLMKDTHDLIHKAVGWALREVGKKDQGVEKKFLDKHVAHMPRTMLRYAIERFSVADRTVYMNTRKVR